MSYILDALKKAEKKRRQGKVPDLLTEQDTTSQRPKRRPLWLYLLLAALLLNAGFLAWWLVPWQPKKTTVVAHSKAGQQLESKVIESPQALPRTVSPGDRADTENIVQQKQPARAKADLKRQAPGRVAPTAPSEPEPPESGVAPVANKVYNLSELPLSVRQNLPDFIISIFLHSDDPASRMVKVNGQMMREGQYLTTGLKLEEITQHGVIFSYQNYRFRVGLK